SFCNRVQIKTPQGVKWLTVPIVRSSRGLIKEAKIDNTSNWRKDHLKSFELNYKRAPFYADMLSLLENIYNQETDLLSDFNIYAVGLITSYLGLSCQFLKSSNLSVAGKASDKLIGIVKEVKGSIYLTGHGAKNYLEYEKFEAQGIQVQYIDYNIKQYNQFFKEFTTYVSILDLIAHNGYNSADLLKSKSLNYREFIHE
ncbi:MAG: WbqC family protein, partial [Alphaproteobacteria bacterium]